jgi:hypothetical protein
MGESVLDVVEVGLGFKADGEEGAGVDVDVVVEEVN